MPSLPVPTHFVGQLAPAFRTRGEDHPPIPRDTKVSILYRQHRWWDLQELKYHNDLHHRRVSGVEMALGASSCTGVSSDFPLALSKTLRPCGEVKSSLTTFLGSCAGTGLGRKHSSCLARGSEKLLWKVKDGQHPPPKPLAPLLVLSASSRRGRGADGGGRAQLVPSNACGRAQGMCW